MSDGLTGIRNTGPPQAVREQPERLNIGDFGPKGRAVVLAPHPDDEVFAIGGTMAMLEWAGYEVEVVAVTDGEGSHPGSSRITPAQLRDLRSEETLRAYRYLGIHPQRFRLGLPDREVASHADALKRIVEIRAHDAAVLFAPLETDGDSDNDAVGSAAAQLAKEHNVQLWNYAIWSQLDPEKLAEKPCRELSLPPEIVARKQRATGVFSSQLYPLGPAPEDRPALPAGFRERFVQPVEMLWRAS